MPSQIRKKAILKKWPCAVCCLSCDVGSVQCDSCEKWVHVKCEGLNEADLKYLSGLTYMCRICISVEDRDSYSYNNALYRLREVCGYYVQPFKYCLMTDYSISFLPFPP
jgi:hypothetical protein